MGISLGLVGLGAFGRVFAPLFKSHPLVDRVGLCDMEPDRISLYATDPQFTDKFNTRDAYQSFDEIVASDLDALVIITQPWLHAEQAVRAMEAGKDVYSAVPILSVPDGDEVLEACNNVVETSKKTGQRYMLGETTYYRPQTMYARKRAAEGAFGDVVYSEGDYLHDVDQATCNLREVAKWRTESKSGQAWLARAKRYEERGVVNGPMHYPTHSVCGPMCVMNAHATKVSCYAHHYAGDDEYLASLGITDETAFFQMSNGSSMRVREYREVGHPGREGFDITGTKASLHGNTWLTNQGSEEIDLADMYDPLPDYVEAAWSTIAKDSESYGGHGGSHPYLVHEFVSAVSEKRHAAINAWEAVRYMAAGVMAHKSALSDGERLDVPDWGDAPE